MKFDLEKLEADGEKEAQKFKDAMQCMALGYEQDLREYNKDLGIHFFRDHADVEHWTVAIQIAYPIFVPDPITNMQIKQTAFSNLGFVRLPLTSGPEEVVAGVKKRLNELFTDPRDLLAQALISIAYEAKQRKLLHGKGNIIQP